MSDQISTMTYTSCLLSVSYTCMFEYVIAFTSVPCKDKVESCSPEDKQRISSSGETTTVYIHGKHGNRSPVGACLGQMFHHGCVKRHLSNVSEGNNNVLPDSSYFEGFFVKFNNFNPLAMGRKYPVIHIIQLQGECTFGIKNGSAEKVNRNSSRKWNSSDSKSSPEMNDHTNEQC